MFNMLFVFMHKTDRKEFSMIMWGGCLKKKSYEIYRYFCNLKHEVIPVSALKPLRHYEQKFLDAVRSGVCRYDGY